MYYINVVDTSNLPRYIEGTYTGRIDWKSSVGYKVKFIYDDINGEIEILNYISGNHPKMEIKYQDKIKLILTDSLINARIGNIVGKRTSDFKANIGDVFKDKNRNITITGVKILESNPKKWYSFKCNVCGWENGMINEYHLLNEKRGCSCCAGRTVVEGINDIPTTAPWMVKYFQGGYDEAKLYTKGSDNKLFFICSDCGKVKSKLQSIDKLNKTRSIGCTCGDGISYPEKFIACVLDQLNVNYTWGYRPNWLIDENGSQRVFDFYLPNQNLIIEMDGGLGHGKIVYKNSIISPEQSALIDIWKDTQATRQKLSVIRINSDKSELKYLKINILNKLSSCFDLSFIDWLKCDEVSTKNIIKTICEFYEHNKPISSRQLADIFNLSQNTIAIYLKKGVTFGWCEYNPSIAQSIGGKKGGQKCGKKVSVYKDGICLGIYSSCRELERRSLCDFGVKFVSTCISNVSLGKQKQHRGFTFRYI